MNWLSAIRLLRCAADPNRIAPSLSVSIPNNTASIQAELFVPTGKGPFPAFLLSHGFNQGGHREPRIMQLASGLCEIGFLVLIPSFPAAEELKVSPETPKQLITAFEWLKNRPDVDSNRLGIFGISYGATLGLIAASDCRIRHDVHFIVALGGYASLETLLAYGRTGKYPKEGPQFSIPPDVYLQEILLRNPGADQWVSDLSIHKGLVWSPGLRVVLMHSESDPVVPWKEMEEIKKLVAGKVAGVNSYLIHLTGHARLSHWMTGISALRAARAIAQLRRAST